MNKTETVVEEHYVCERCEISSNTEGRMIPCPRGSCDAQHVANKTITTIITYDYNVEQSPVTKLVKSSIL